MGDDAPDMSSDGGEGAPRGAFITYSRMTLLALYESPLVPSKLEGMRDLSDWYGEYTQPPASPPTRARDMHHNTQHPSGRHSRRDGTIDSSTSPSSHSATRSNPFTNFGRFGVDGGLEGTDAIGSASKFASLANLGSSSDKRKSAREGANANNGDTTGRTRYVESGKPGTSYFTNERERGERMKAKLDGQVRGGERKDEAVVVGVNKKDRRSDDGGWRSVPAREDRRSARNADATAGSSRDNRRDERGAASNRSNRPAWMDDDGGKPSSAPAWMDEPTSGMMSFESGQAFDKPAVAVADGLDSIQAFKKQMKELEGRGQQSDQAGISANTQQMASSEPKASVFANLINKADKSEQAAPVKPDDSTGAREFEQAAEAGAGGRSSRFARFFDGKPSTQQTQTNQMDEQPASVSIFDAMLSNAAKTDKPKPSAGPSKEDADSMTRLLGMLQLSGARAASPVETRTKAATPTPPQPSLQGTLADASQDERKSSRFGFSAGSSQDTARPASSTPTITSSLQSFGLPQLATTSKLAANPQQDLQSQQPHQHLRSSSGQISNASGNQPGLNSNFTGPPHPPHSMSPSRMTSPPFQHLPGAGQHPLLSPMSAASHPLPPPGLAAPMINSSNPHNSTLGPNARSMNMPPISGPPPADMPPHLRHLLSSSGPGLFPPPSQQSGPPSNADMHGSMVQGNLARSPLPPGMSQPPPPRFMFPAGPPQPPPPGFTGPMPPNFRGMPAMPPHSMTNVPFNAQGLPDLMALLNSGGGGGAATSRLPPREPQQQ
ncbi:hypothetical protein OIO90_006485 [Microbotryomycetes sp. JL221]|nr:hypothetical protein OIO90_006485 [Microbotryomycetes sp. JL221]